MKKRNLLLGGISGAVAFFLLGWLIYGVLLAEYSKANYNQCASRPMAEMKWWAMIISDLAYGYLLSVILYWSNGKGIIAGAKTGAVLGILVAISMDFSMYSMSSVYLNFGAVCIDIIVYSIMSAITGMAVGLFMKK